MTRKKRPSPSRIPAAQRRRGRPPKVRPNDTLQVYIVNVNGKPYKVYTDSAGHAHSWPERTNDVPADRRYARRELMRQLGLQEEAE